MIGYFVIHVCVSRAAAQCWLDFRHRINRSLLPSFVTVNVQSFIESIITCLWLNMTKTIDPLLSQYLSITQGKWRGCLFEGRCLFLIFADRRGAYLKGVLIWEGTLIQGFTVVCLWCRGFANHSLHGQDFLCSLCFYRKGNLLWENLKSIWKEMYICSCRRWKRRRNGKQAGKVILNWTL